MTNMKFRINKPHGKMPEIAELWRDGIIVAGVYPHEDGIQIVSKYLDGVKHEPGYPPSVVVHLSKEASE